MKNSKILPFGDWFKVYEKAGNNFNKTQRLLESQMISEAKSYIDLPQAGENLGSNIWSALSEVKLKAKYDAIYSYIINNKRNSNIQASITEMNKLKAIDRKIVSAGFVTGVSTAENMLAFNAAICAAELGVKAKWFIENRLSNMTVTVERKPENDIKLTPSGSGGYIYTSGAVSNVAGSAVSKNDTDAVSSYDRLKFYINHFNYMNLAGGNDCYNGDSVNDKGFFDLSNAAGAAASASIYLASTYEGGAVERSETEEVDVIGAETAQVGQADIKFKAATLDKGGADILDTEAGKIEALANTIMEKFAGKTINNFELLSSASPEYGNLKNETGWESNYTQTTGTGDPGAGTDDATNNCKLAYERGVSFMTALNTKLNAMGHPGFATYQIKWQIAAKGGPADDGRFVDLQISTNEKKGTVVKKTDVNGKELAAATKASGRSEATLYAYNIAW